jgi:cytochrome b6-f complex iron-sulfur subunit
VGSLLNFIWPRRTGVFGGSFVVPAKEVPEPGGEPVWFPTGRFYLAHLAPGQEGSPGGLLAVYQKCTHLGCTVPWRPEFVFDDPASGQEKVGWYRCPCHGSTYTQGAAILVFGPAPRPLDTMALEVKKNGDVVVDTGAITLGSKENSLRVVPYNQPTAVRRRAARGKV